MKTFKYNENKLGIEYKQFDKEEISTKIKEFEEKNNIILPKDYKKFLLKYNGGRTYKVEFEKKGWKSSFYGDGINIDNFLSIEEIQSKGFGSYFDVIADQESEFEKLKPVRKYVCFAIADGSYKILISCEEEDYSTIYLQDDRNREEFYIEKVTDNLKDFIQNLKRDLTVPGTFLREILIKREETEEKKEKMRLKFQEEDKKLFETDYVELSLQ